MKKQIAQVLEFHTLFDREINVKEFTPFRGDLQVEEALELRKALEDKDLVEVADAVIDTLYIAIGTAIHFGFQDKLEAMFDAVHKSNLSKLDPITNKPTVREDGKVLKGANFKPPTEDIKRILTESDICPHCNLTKAQCKKASETLEFKDGLD